MPVKRRLAFSSAKQKRGKYFPRYRGLATSGAVGSKRYATMVYNDTIEISLTSIPFNYHYFRANSIYDPDFTSTGHQASGHDELANLYSRYTVVSCGMRVDFASTSPASAGQCIAGVRLDNDGATVGTAKETMEQRGTKYLLLSDADGGPNTGKLYTNFNCKRDFGLDPYVDTAGNISSDFGSSPNHSKYFQIFAYNPAGDTGSTVTAVVTMYYKVLLTQPVDLGLS